MLLGLVSILGIVAVVLTASNHGALVDMKAPPAATASLHDHDLEEKIDSVKAEMGKKTDIQGLATKDKLKDLSDKVSTDNAKILDKVSTDNAKILADLEAIKNSREKVEVFAITTTTRTPCSTPPTSSSTARTCM